MVVWSVVIILAMLRFLFAPILLLLPLVASAETIYGTVVAVLLLGVLRTAMGVANVKVESQLAVVGTLLIVAVVVSDALGRRRK